MFLSYEFHKLLKTLVMEKKRVQKVSAMDYDNSMTYEGTMKS